MKSLIVTRTVPIAKKVLPESVYTRTKMALARLAWKLDGGMVPPSGVKIQWVRHFQRLYNISALVEKGTRRGDMITAVRRSFREIYSVEFG